MHSLPKLCRHFLFILICFTQTNGIAGNLDSAFLLAKQYKKPVLVYFHYNGCGACARMEKETLSDSITKRILANEYIFMSVNTLKGEGPQLKNQFDIVAHPAFLFINPDKTIYHKLVGYIDKQKFESTLQNEGMLKNPGSLLFQKQKYNDGCRDSAFLLKYIYTLKDASELNETVVTDYYNSGAKYSAPDAMKLFYDVSYHKGNSYIKFNSPYFKFVLGNKNIFYAKYDSSQIDVRIIFICFDAVKEAKHNNDPNLFEASIKILRPYDNKGVLDLRNTDGEGNSAMVMTKNMSTYTLVDFYHNRDNNLFKKYSREKKKLIWNDVEELDNLSWMVAKYSKDSTRYEDALMCAQRSVDISPNETNYYTIALLYYKLGDLNKSEEACLKSIEYGRKNGKKCDDQTKLLQKIEAGAQK